MSPVEELETLQMLQISNCHKSCSQTMRSGRCKAWTLLHWGTMLLFRYPLHFKSAQKLMPTNFVVNSLWQSSWWEECCSWEPTLVDWPPRPLMSTGPRPRTLATTWDTTRPGEEHWNFCNSPINVKHSGNSNGSTLLARTTRRLLLTEWPGGRLTTGQI